MITWSIDLSPDRTELSWPSYDYAKANFTAVKRSLQGTDWDEMLQGNVKDKWTSSKKHLAGLEAWHVPLKGTSQRRKKAKWTSYKAIKLICKKHSLYAKYKTVVNKHILKQQRSKKRNREIQSSEQRFGRKLAMKIKEDDKTIYSYIRSGGRGESYIR